MNHRWTHILCAATLAALFGLYGSEPAPQQAAIRRTLLLKPIVPGPVDSQLPAQPLQPVQTVQTVQPDVIVTLWRHDGEIRVLASPAGPMYEFRDAAGDILEPAMTLDQLYVHRPDLHRRVRETVVSSDGSPDENTPPFGIQPVMMIMADVEVD
jgi:hypothetical protein